MDVIWSPPESVKHDDACFSYSANSALFQSCFSDQAFQKVYSSRQVLIRLRDGSGGNFFAMGKVMNLLLY